MDLKHHLIRQMVFSRATFGPGERREGVLDHLSKEIAEVRASDGDHDEWVDLVILSLDGLTRRLWSEFPAPVLAPSPRRLAILSSASSPKTNCAHGRTGAMLSRTRPLSMTAPGKPPASKPAGCSPPMG